MKPRPYQQAALDALFKHLLEKENNPCVVIPTGGGKSPVIAWTIQHYHNLMKKHGREFRCIVLQHRKELVEQNSDELKGIEPSIKIGINCAKLKKRDYKQNVVFAMIDSVYNKAHKFEPFDLIIVDEAHRIPQNGEGKYRKFIQEAQAMNSKSRVVGFTATPYRLGCGAICHKDHILHEICYEVKIDDLIRKGHLCKLRGKQGEYKIDFSNIKKSAGDYNQKQLSEIFVEDLTVQKAIAESLSIIKAEKRKSIIFFCIDVEHSKAVQNELLKYGINAPVVDAKTKDGVRDRIVNDFKAGRVNHLININVYTEGFNAKQVDCIVMLRPTLSKGLYVQMVGRGLRLHPDKEDCLILDYANNIEEHGPIDMIGSGETRVVTCKGCGDVFSRAVRICPNCGWEIPKQQIEAMEKEDRQRRLHKATSSNAQIIAGYSLTVDVENVSVSRHRKIGKPDQIRIIYESGFKTFTQYLGLDHGSIDTSGGDFAERTARRWWSKFISEKEAETITVNGALEDMLLADRIKDTIKTITVTKNRDGFWNVTGWDTYVTNNAVNQ
jgi:DNA repair protein RadD